MSVIRDVRYGRWHPKTWTDRRMRHIQNTGALVVTAAGDNGRSVDGDTLWVPCESTHVLCVGGAHGGAARTAGSNYGAGDSSTSVEIYGPMCVRTVAAPDNASATWRPATPAARAWPHRSSALPLLPGATC